MRTCDPSQMDFTAVWTIGTLVRKEREREREREGRERIEKELMLIFFLF